MNLSIIYMPELEYEVRCTNILTEFTASDIHYIMNHITKDSYELKQKEDSRIAIFVTDLVTYVLLAEFFKQNQFGIKLNPEARGQNNDYNRK